MNKGIADITVGGEKMRHDYIRHVEAFAKFSTLQPATTSRAASSLQQVDKARSHQR
jgi:hypothetical protein